MILNHCCPINSKEDPFSLRDDPMDGGGRTKFGTRVEKDRMSEGKLVLAASIRQSLTRDLYAMDNGMDPLHFD
jgi:hypothetical protein